MAIRIEKYKMANKETKIIQNFINGSFQFSESYMDSPDPSTGHTFAKVPSSTEEDVNNAVEAAKSALKSWGLKSVAERSQLLNRLADLIESNLEGLAEAESRDQGKPLHLARTVDIPRAVVNFRHFANSALCDTDICINEPHLGVLNYTVHVPVGVVAVISPWNFPLYILTFKLAPALVYGNTVVAKPSECTSVTAWMLCQLIQEAGFPPGVVNMIFGLGRTVGEALVLHKDVSAISFTGSTVVGTHIAEVTANNAKKLSLEMGGKNAAIIFDDANITDTVSTLVRSSFFNSGQVCLCTSRVFVQRKIFSEFVEMFVDASKKFKVGSPESNDTSMGPVVSKEHYQKVRGFIDAAKKQEATFVLEQTLNLPVHNQGGYFIAPVILTDVSDTSTFMQDEIFGPITCVTPFDTEEEVIERANQVKYGLCAAIFTTNVSRIHRVAPQLEAGTVWCNCWLIRNLHMPFGGVKLSGIGREGTQDSRDFYTEKKSIVLKI